MKSKAVSLKRENSKVSQTGEKEREREETSHQHQDKQM